MKQKRATIQPLIHHQSTLQSNLNLIMITEELSPSPLDFSYYLWAYWILILIMYNYTIALDHYLLCICHYKQKVASQVIWCYLWYYKSNSQLPFIVEQKTAFIVGLLPLLYILLLYYSETRHFATGYYVFLLFGYVCK